MNCGLITIRVLASKMKFRVGSLPTFTRSSNGFSFKYSAVAPMNDSSFHKSYSPLTPSNVFLSSWNISPLSHNTSTSAEGEAAASLVIIRLPVM